MNVETPETHAVPAAIPRLPRRQRQWQRLVGESPAARRLESLIQRAAAVESTVLITGETGTGKEEVARAIHAHSDRCDAPFLAINCGAMAATLIESQLFGHEKGAFTGAVGPSLGAFRAASGGVVFLDEIGEMPLELQPRLLRVLQQREVTPLGSSATIPVDVQVIAATNRDLGAQVGKGAFREDLFYRLNTIELEIPPLRERLDDIPLFVDHFADFYAAKLGLPRWTPDEAVVARFIGHAWPGNVRQLAQTIERVYVLGVGPALAGTFPSAAAPPARATAQPASSTPSAGFELPAELLNLEALRRFAVRQALARTDGHKGRAAELLGVHINTMTRLVEEAVPVSSQRRIGRPRKAR
jgi:DNA-binding NtrC family response regulator